MNEIFKDSSVKELYKKLAHSSANDPYEDAVSFLGFLASSKESEECILKLRCSVSALAKESEDSSSIERQAKFLLMLQFEHSKSLPTADPFCPNDDLAEWASEVLERLRICASSQSQWKNFIRYALVERFKNTHRNTLSLIYSNIGLKRPPCLPRLSDEEGADPEETDSPLTQSEKTPEPQTSDSPLKGKTARQSVESPSRYSAESSIRSKSSCQNVLMPSAARSSLRSKRKATNPTKRASSPATSPSLAAVIGKARKPRQRKTSISQKPVLKKRMPPGVKKVGFKNRGRSVQNGDENPTPQHPSVTETPNPKASYPRWERARMAAAAKIKNKNVVVAESPLKSDSVIGSPLRRLRRASSYLSFVVNDNSQSSSQLGARAERYQRRLLEEETSLSQFSGESNSATQPVSTSASSSDFRRRSSNLMVNFASPRTPLKPSLNSAISSPPVLSASKRRLTGRTTGFYPQHFEIDESFSKRQKVELDVGAVGQIIPGEYDEDAMFLGEDEFLQHTNTPPRTCDTQDGAVTLRTPRKFSTPVSPSNTGDQTIPKTPTKNRVCLRGAAGRRGASERKSQNEIYRTPKKRSPVLPPSKNTGQSILMTQTRNRTPRSPGKGARGTQSCKEILKKTQRTPGRLSPALEPTVGDLSQPKTPIRKRLPLSPIGNVHNAENSGRKSPRTPSTESQPRLNRKRTPLSPIGNAPSLTENSEYLSSPKDLYHEKPYPSKPNGRASRLIEEIRPRYESPSGPAGNTRSSLNNLIPSYSFGRRTTPRKSLFSTISSYDDSVYSQETPNSSADNSSTDTPQKRLFHSPNKVIFNTQFLQHQQQIFLETEVLISPQRRCPS